MIICHSYIVCSDDIPDDSDTDTGEESSRGRESDVDGHEMLGNMSRTIEVEAPDEMEASHDGLLAPESRSVESSGECASTGNDEMVEMVQVTGGVHANEITEANEDILEHGTSSCLGSN